MKRLRILPLLILLILLTSCGSGQDVTPTKQTGVLSLDTIPECRALREGLCMVSEPGEWLGEGQTIIINEKPEAVYLEPSTAIEIKIGEWTLIFDPGEGKPFSVGMTFPNAKLYPQGKGVGMSIETSEKKCDVVEGLFSDDILQSAEEDGFGKNPIEVFDIRFAMRCNDQPQVIKGRVKLTW
jgi:hypothetical protein